MQASGRTEQGRAEPAGPILEELRTRLLNLRSEVQVLYERLSLVAVTDSAAGSRVSALPRSSSFTTFYARCLGSFSLFRGESELPLARSKPGLEICRYLVTHAGERISSETLVELVWPDAEPEVATHRLHVAVSALRRIVDTTKDEESAIRFEDGTYTISESTLITDCRLFDSHYEIAKRRLAARDLAGAAHAFAQAVDLYQGDYLSDASYVEWTQDTRAHYATRHLNALNFLCDQAEREHDYFNVLEYAGAILEIDNLLERAHRALMRAHYELGQRAIAIRQFALCAELLRNELGVRPSRVTRALYEAIRDDTQLPDDLQIAV